MPLKAAHNNYTLALQIDVRSTMSAPELQIGLDLQIMIAHPRAQGEPEPQARRASSIRKFLNREPSDGKKWPSEKLILPAHDDQFGFPAKRCIWKVCDVLAKAGFPVACSYPLEPRRGEPLTLGMNKSNTAVVTGRNGCQYRTWNAPEAFHLESPRDRYWFVNHELGVTECVKKELQGEKPPGYRWYCVGLKAPLILVRKSNDLADLLSIKSVLEVLKSALKLWTNNLCGLSIHVSQTDGELTRIVVKKAAALTALLEAPLLSKFFDPRRLANNQVSFISTHSRIASGQWDHAKEDVDSKALVRHLAQHQIQLKTRSGGNSLYHLTHRILTQVDIQSLHDGLQQEYGELCSFNVTTDGVIEFSYPETSFQIEYVAIWVDIARKVVEVAMGDERGYGTVLGKLMDLRGGSREMGWINYWDVLGVRDKRDESSRMWWVKSIANGYRLRERVNGVVSL